MAWHSNANARYKMNLGPDYGSGVVPQNVHRRSFSSPSMNMFGSFTEGGEGRVSGTRKAISRGSAMSVEEDRPLSESLILEPIVMGDKKFSRSSELKRILGTSEDKSSGVGHLKAPSPIAMEELKRFKASVADSCAKASVRAKKLDEHLNELHKYSETMTPEKQHWNDELTNDRSTSSNSKIGAEMHHCGLSELVAHKFEDGRNNIVLNRRLRTPVPETRMDFRDNRLLRQPAGMTKEQFMLEDSSADADIGEESIRKLPAGGEGWDKKMRSKRSAGTVFSRSVDSDGGLRRNMHDKFISEPCRYNILDSTMSPFASGAHATMKNEQEKYGIVRDLHAKQNKERVLGKGNIKLNSGEENISVSPSPVVKGKASRAPQTAYGTNLPSTVKFRVPVTLESWEQPEGVNENPPIGSRKRGLVTGPSSPLITDWAGQRPQKISRPRRSNLLPVSNSHEAQIPSEGGSPSELGARLNSNVSKAPPITRNVATATQNFKVKFENVPSPSRLPESENRLKERGVGSVGFVEKDEKGSQNIGPSEIVTKKNNIVVKETKGDGAQKQGQSGGLLRCSRPSTSPMREKLDNTATNKPLRSPRSGSGKNESKSGRLSKKPSDCKGCSRLARVTNGGSSDVNGESEDDREELLEAANSARNFNAHACSSPFWKKVESYFAPISADVRSFISEQLKSAEEFSGSVNQIFTPGNDIRQKLGDRRHEEISTSNSLSGERNGHMENQTGLKDSSDTEEVGVSLSQRLLSAIIVEDEIEETEENGFERPRSSSNDPCFLSNSESNSRYLPYFSEPIVGIQSQTTGSPNQNFSCIGNSDDNRVHHSTRVHPYSSEILQGESSCVLSEVEMLAIQCDYDELCPQTTSHGVSSSDFRYDEMSVDDKIVLELQSLGLDLETVPPLSAKEDRAIDQEIAQLERELHESTGKKKMYLDKLYKAIQEENDGERNHEQVAMDKFVDVAYRKLSATRASFASKHGIPRVSKKSALEFAQRTLSRCQKFEDSGTSCFAELPLRDIVYAPPPKVNELDADVAVANGSFPGCTNGSLIDAFETSQHRCDHDFAKNGSISNRGKKKEVFLDDLGDAEGNRSERDIETSNRNPAPKNGRSSMGNSKGERKTRAKPRQKTARLSMSRNEFVNKRDIESTSSYNGPPDLLKETEKSIDIPNLPLNDIDSIELGIDSDIGGMQDLNSLLSFDEIGVPEIDGMGLSIPQDNLTDIFNF